jgi:hypothetical protein
VNLLKKGEMDVDLPTLFCTVGWSFVEEIRQIEHTMEG